MITPYQIEILKTTATYDVVTRAMLQNRCCPNDKDGRVTRKRILQLVQPGLLNKMRMEVVNPAFSGGATPTYFSSRKGLEFLACHTGDDSWLCRPCATPAWQTLLHTLDCAAMHMMFDDAIALQSIAALGGWISEWEVCNAQAKDPGERFRLYTKLSESPRLICNPDFAFMLQVGGYSKTYYGEVDRSTSGISQIAHSKTPGYAGLAERKLYRRHFETNTDSFFVLHISPTVPRRNAVCKAIADKPGAALWKFAAFTDLRPDTLLFEPVWLRCDGQMQPLIKRLPSPAEPADAGSGSGPEGVPAVIRCRTCNQSGAV